MSVPPEVSAARLGRRHKHEGDRLPSGAGPAAILLLSTLGVVYGDLGTSVIYALQAIFTGANLVLLPNQTNILGVLSLIFWTLIAIVTFKYMVFVLRADNHGEGGTFALIALLRPWRHTDRFGRHARVLLGLAGASMLYAGIMITPAISILSAVEGLKIASPATSNYVIPLTIVILVALFAVQRFGTAKIGIAFGPIMLAWFVALTALGIRGILAQPLVLHAVDPRYAVHFFQQGGIIAFLILFAVFLVTTGAESLYADIGHFGRAPIRRLWLFLVLPALLANYFGQGAMLLADPHAIEQPFFHLVPKALLYPMVGLATLATIIASQAAITGAFSMTNQAAKLGMMPPSRVVQTSKESAGQVYVPFMNWLLMAAAIVLVLLFRNSTALASTYGISVSTTMIVTTILAFLVARERGRRSLVGAYAFLLVFLAIDLAYFSSNLLRIPHGGWFPVLVGVVFFTVMSTWRRGTDLLTRKTDEVSGRLAEVMEGLSARGVVRVPGCAVFLTQRSNEVPATMMRHIERNHALQQTVVLLGIAIDDVPHTAAAERAEHDELLPEVHRVTLHYGYLDDMSVDTDLAACLGRVLAAADGATYYVARPSPISGRGRLDGMIAWRDRLFTVMKRNSADATADYNIPHDAVIEMGMKVAI